MPRLDGKVAIISGGARGMGATEAKMFAREGARVVFGDIREDEGKRVEAEIQESGGDALYVHLDVAREEDWREAVGLAATRYGTLHILVNNAGIGGGGKVEDTTVDEWERVMEVNINGVFLGTKAVIPFMRMAGGGSIINISSEMGIAPSARTGAPYVASKGAVRLFTKATAVQYAKDGIRANSVHPGPIATPMSEATRANPELNQGEVSQVPLGRWGQPEEVAYGVIYLASDESSFVTGSELVIDGGATAQ